MEEKSKEMYAVSNQYQNYTKNIEGVMRQRNRKLCISIGCAAFIMILFGIFFISR